MAIKSHSFHGRKYLIDIGPCDGLCNTHTCEREIHIFKDLNTRGGLETAIHEALHASQWPASEESVERTAYDIARFLWRLNYRLGIEQGEHNG